MYLLFPHLSYFLPMRNYGKKLCKFYDNDSFLFLLHIDIIFIYLWWFVHVKLHPLLYASAQIKAHNNYYSLSSFDIIVSSAKASS